MFYLINILTLGCNGAMMIHDDLVLVAMDIL